MRRVAKSVNFGIIYGISSYGLSENLEINTREAKQFIDTYHMGIRVNDNATVYLHDDVNNIYNQEYVKDTNILKTEVINTYFNVGAIQ